MPIRDTNDLHTMLPRARVLRCVKRSAVAVLVIVLCALAIRSVSAAERDLRDLYFGEALFYAYQDDYFAAIARFDTELTQYYALEDPKKDTLTFHREESELMIGDLELSYRMHRKVGRAMKRLLAESVHESIRDRAAYRLGRIAFTTADYDGALAILDHIGKRAPEALKHKAALLRGEALIALGRFDEAIGALKPVRNADEVEGFAAYNLGIALMESGDTASGLRQLDEVGDMKGRSRELSALSDKANLALGYALLNAEQPERARPYLERVRLEGPFSNKALLWVGWTDAARQRYKEALVPWMLLRKRDVTDIAVQEAMLAAPYGFGQLKAYGRAAVLYGEAVESFEHEIQRLDQSVVSIREGKFLDAMLQEEAEHEDNWLVRMRELPDAPETRYLADLMTGHAFHQSYSNYRDLDFLRRNIEDWRNAIPGYRDLLALRRQYYEPLLPRIEQGFNEQDRRLNAAMKRRDQLSSDLKALMRKRNPMVLATRAERDWLNYLRSMEKRVQRLPAQPGKENALARVRRLIGVVEWRIDTEYESRLSLAHKHLKELDEAIATTRAQHRALARAKAEARLSYQGYDRPLDDFQARLDYLHDRINGVIAHQGQYMQRRAVHELERRKERLQQYRSKARFALAESYDRATREKKGEKSD